MFRLDRRLQAVSDQIRAARHVDIGSDHAQLLVALLGSGRIEHGIAIENKRQPFDNSCRALEPLSAEVRFGDGLAVLEPHEADSLSICGMGADRIVKILEAFPERVPRRIVLQPNRQPELIRRWALRCGFLVVDERIARGHWPYSIMSFQRVQKSPEAAESQQDPAYEHVDLDAAILFGPLNLKRMEPAFRVQMQQELDYLNGFDRLGPQQIAKRTALRRVLAS